MGVWMKRPVISSESVLSVSRAELRRLLKGHLYSDGCRDAGDAGDPARSARLRSSHLVIIIVRLQRTPYRLEHDPCLIVTLSPAPATDRRNETVGLMDCPPCDHQCVVNLGEGIQQTQIPLSIICRLSQCSRSRAKPCVLEGAA